MQSPCFVVGLYLIDEAGFSNIWKTTDDDGSGIWVNGWETGKVLTYFLQVLQVLALTFHYSGHPEAIKISCQTGPKKIL
jgi:hypothetical protein